MNALTRARSRSRGIANSAHTQALSLKAAGHLSNVITPGFSNVYKRAVESNTHRRNYAQNRTWLYAAINAVASEGAAQPFRMGQIVTSSGALQAPERGVADFLIHKMPDSIRSHAIRRKSASSKLEIIEDHDMITALEAPNDAQGRWQFVYSFIANLALTGWSYIIGGPKSNNGYEFYSIPTTWVTPVHVPGPFAKFWLRDPDKPESEGQLYDRNSVAFAHLPDPSDPLSALAPATSQNLAIRIDDHIQTSQERFFENGIFPSAIVTIGKDPHPEVPFSGMRPRLTGTQRRQVIGAIRKAMSGVSNYGNPAIVDGLIESIDRLSATANEMGWKESEQTARTRILSAYGVHPYILGEPMNIGGYAQAAVIEQRFCKQVNKYLELLSCVMSNFVTQIDASNEKLLVWWDQCSPSNEDLKWKNLREGRKNGDITRNEFRAMLNLPPDETGGDRTRHFSPGDIHAIVQSIVQVAQGRVTTDQLTAMFEFAFDLTPEEAFRLAGSGLVRVITQPEQPNIDHDQYVEDPNADVDDVDPPNPIRI